MNEYEGFANFAALAALAIIALGILCLTGLSGYASGTAHTCNAVCQTTDLNKSYWDAEAQTCQCVFPQPLNAE